MWKAFFCLTALALTAAPSAAQGVEYAYTAIDLKKCKPAPGMRPDANPGLRLCPGHDNIQISLSSFEQRSFVSFGSNPKRELANRESLMSQNGEGNTVEWRIETRADGTKRAFAAIMRWYTAVTPESGKGEVQRGQVLVVTRLNPGGVCHVGYVDARANPDANALARRIADERARGFRCGKDTPDAHGVTGPGFSPRLLME